MFASGRLLKGGRVAERDREVLHPVRSAV